MASKLEMDDDEVMAEINIVPFVDIVLVVLIIFMVTSTAIVKASFNVDLPKAANGGEEVSTTLNIVIGKENGSNFLNLDGIRMTSEQLSSAVAKAKSLVGKGDLNAVIAADQAIPYGEVVNIIDIIKGEGITGFALNVERKAPTLNKP